jgi:hypothetical protein
VVAIGDRYEVVLAMGRLDEMLGDAPLPSATDSFDVLADRAIVLMQQAERYGVQLPHDHYEDVIPGMENVTVPLILPGNIELRLSDGTPYVPHRTSIGLFRHIIGHGAKFLLLATEPEADYTHVGEYAQLGEPTEDRSIEVLGDDLHAVVDGVAAWAAATESSIDLDRVLATFIGQQTQRQMLETNLFSLGQHTRQLMTVIADLGIEPDGRLPADLVEALKLPERIWD